MISVRKDTSVNHFLLQNNDGFFKCAIGRDALQGYEGRKCDFGTNGGGGGTNDGEKVDEGDFF